MPNTVNALHDALEAFDDHGNLVSTLDASPEAKTRSAGEQLGELVDLDEVSASSGRGRGRSFATSFDEVLATLAGVGPSVDG